jgi:hypothetical protein
MHEITSQADCDKAYETLGYTAPKAHGGGRNEPQGCFLESTVPKGGGAPVAAGYMWADPASKSPIWPGPIDPDCPVLCTTAETVIRRLDEDQRGEGEGNDDNDDADRAVPVSAAPPVLHICGPGATGIQVKDMQIGNSAWQQSASPGAPGVLVASTCTADDTGTADLPRSEDVLSIQTRARQNFTATATPTYRLPPKIDATAIGTGMSVSFSRVYTLGGGYAAGNPILLRGLKRGDLVWLEMVLGPVNVTDSGDAVVLIGFH